MAKAQTAVLSRIEVQQRPELPLAPPADPPLVPDRREPRTADRIHDALLRWLEEEA
jgi:hypothetical protein